MSIIQYFGSCRPFLRCLQLQERKFAFSHIQFCTESTEEIKKIKNVAILDANIDKQFDDGLKYRFHSGKRQNNVVEIPEPLLNAANNFLSKYNPKELIKKVETLNNIIMSRRLPIENREISERAAILQAKFKSKIKNFDELPQEEKVKTAENIEEKIMNILRKRLYHWKPIEYDFNMGVVYAIARLAPNYASLMRVFSEIEATFPDYKPETLMDFGSGIGTVTWAARNTWKNPINEITAIDSSADMNQISQILQNDGNAEDFEYTKGYFYKQFLPVSSALKYDLVVCAHTLLDLPSISSRVQIIDSLWDKTNNFLVIIERGSNAGYTAVLEAREYILQLADRTSKVEDVGHVIAPCSHDHPCPRYEDGTGTPCNFFIRYKNLRLIRSPEVAEEPYSYVILKKGARNENTVYWPRVVRPVLVRAKHAICRLCTSDGQLDEVICSKGNSSKNLYRCARSAVYGDLLPVSVEKKIKEPPRKHLKKEINVEVI